MTIFESYTLPTLPLPQSNFFSSCVKNIPSGVEYPNDLIKRQANGGRGDEDGEAGSGGGRAGSSSWGVAMGTGENNWGS